MKITLSPPRPEKHYYHYLDYRNRQNKKHDIVVVDSKEAPIHLQSIVIAGAGAGAGATRVEKENLAFRTYQLIKEDARWLMIGILAMISTTICSLYIPILLQSIIDEATYVSSGTGAEVLSKAKANIIMYLIQLGGWIIGESISQYLQSYSLQLVGSRLVKTCRDKVFSSALNAGAAAGTKGSTATEILTKIEKSEEFQSIIEGRFELMSHIFYVVGGLIIVTINYKNSWELSLVIFIMCVCMFLVSYPYKKLIAKLTNEYIDLTAKIGSIIQNKLASAGAGAASAGSIKEKSKKRRLKSKEYDETSQKLYDFTVLKLKYNVRYQGCILFLTRVGVALSIWQASTLVLNGSSSNSNNLTSGDLVGFFIYSDLIYSHMWSTLLWVQSYEETNVTLEMLLNLTFEKDF